MVHTDLKYMYICTHKLYMYYCIHTHMNYMCTYKHTYAYINYMYVYIHMHTHMHMTLAIGTILHTPGTLTQFLNYVFTVTFLCHCSLYVNICEFTAHKVVLVSSCLP